MQRSKISEINGKSSKDILESAISFISRRINVQAISTMNSKVHRVFIRQRSIISISFPLFYYFPAGCLSLLLHIYQYVLIMPAVQSERRVTIDRGQRRVGGTWTFQFSRPELPVFFSSSLHTYFSFSPILRLTNLCMHTEHFLGT